MQLRRLSMTLLVLITACSGDRVAAGGRHAWTHPHVLRIADIGEPDHLNPYLSQMDLVYDFSSLVYSFLIVSDANGRLIGDLAADVPSLDNGGISSDGKIYTYHLRRGVRWHDGAPLTSRDVVASWRAVMDPSHATLHREGYDRIERIDTPDARTAVVHLRERYPPFESIFFTPLQEGGKPVLPAHVLAGGRSFSAGPIATHPIGTGPFRFVRWERGSRIVLERYDAYFKGRPRLQRVELRTIPDDATIVTQMHTHEIDLVVAPQTADFPVYRRFAGTATGLAAWNAQDILSINSSRPALRDRAVRRAVASAIDYQTFASKITGGIGRIARSSLPRTALGWVPLAPRRLDLARANALLDADGWTRGPDGIRSRDGARLSFVLASIAGARNFTEMAVSMEQTFRLAGIDLTVKTYPYTTIFAPDGPILSGRYDLAIYSTTLNWDPDAHAFLACDQWYPKGQNTFRSCDPALDALERAGLRTDRPQERAAIYREASARIWNDIPYVALLEVRRPLVYSQDLKHFSVNPTATPWWNAYQWDI